MGDDFSQALRKNFAKMSIEGGSSEPKSKKSTSKTKPRERISDKIPKDSPLAAGMVHADNVIERAREEVEWRKAAKKDRKTICGRCGKHQDNGARLQTCSRCRSINYCSPQCQKDHWKSGHKVDCPEFKQPPLAKSFDPSDRPDVPWPHDPIFAQGNQEGIGAWITTSGELGCLLQQAFEPPDGNFPRKDPLGPPSFQRWAKVGPHGDKGARGNDFNGPELKNYLGSTLLSLRMVVQNRRRDDKVVAIDAANTALSVSTLMKDNLFPADREKAIMSNSSNGQDTMIVPPWVDYNGMTRVAIVEINGSLAPKGNFGADGEYKTPTRPTGEPWNRVMNWEFANVLLAPGDFVVFRLQYRVGDGNLWNSYPDVMSNFALAGIRSSVLKPKTADDSWVKEATLLYLTRGGEKVTLIAPADFKYIEEYYRPYFDEDSDIWAEKRQGGRAKEANDMLKKTGPAMLRAMMGSMTPENRAEAARRFKSMGFDIDVALQQ